MNIPLRFSIVAVSFGIAAGSLYAKPVPANLGNGLDRLVQSHLDLQAASKRAKINSVRGQDGKSYTTEENAILANLALTDAQDRLLVRINFDGQMTVDDTISGLSKAISTLTVTAVDKAYRGVGVANAYVSIDDVPALAQMKGVRSVILELRPRHNKVDQKAVETSKSRGPVGSATVGQIYPNLGTFFDQGVIQHRVDGINRYYNAGAPVDFEGANMSIACLSNSFAANTAHPASLDVSNNDLPGSGSNPVGNNTPVFVLQDDLASTSSDDEGRGMCQIVYHMAPKAKVGYATADGGEVGFANNIRGLAGFGPATLPGQTYAADVICDDVGYFDEPFFEDGIIGAGVNDVAAAGVSYFSSAANDIGINGYDSDTRWVANGTGLSAAAGNTALAGTNINLANVPPALYAGGFHNFNPNTGQLDVAQTVNIASNANEPPTVLQWNNPYDQNTSPTYTATLFMTTDTYTNADKSYAVPGTITQGTLYEVAETATAGSTFDGIITVYKSDGTTVIAGPQDTGTDEVVRFYAPANDTGFVVKVGHFSTTTGQFTLLVRSASGFASPIPDRLSLLVFNLTTGAYISTSSLTADTTATNQPIQLGATLRPSGQTQVQYVIARAAGSAPTSPTRLRYQIPGNGVSGIGPAEYFTYNTVTTSGHAIAVGCNGTAAYSPFRPNIPENFTSPGPATIFFDANQNPLATPEIRLQPRVAACDGANISVNEGAAGLGSDSSSDYDAAANFFGTSAAAPHAAACALLVLEAHGGRFSVTPSQMTKILQTTAYPHDLDPNYSSGTARAIPSGGKVTLSFGSDNESNNSTGGNDTNALAVSYVGPSFISSLVFNQPADAAHAGNPTAGNNGLDLTNAYTNNSFPGLVFANATKAFTVGTGSVGLVQADAVATFSGTPPAPSTTQTWTMSLAFPNNNFTGGKILKFTVGRAIQHSSVVPSGTNSTNYSADLFGGGVLIPEGNVINNGMTFSGTLGDGSTFTGTINNRIGAGYSKLDGFGFINVQAAVAAPLP
ncbi:MAG: S8 family serine peptidase [Chthoniobacterales bacterium]